MASNDWRRRQKFIHGVTPCADGKYKGFVYDGEVVVYCPEKRNRDRAMDDARRERERREHPEAPGEKWEGGE